jgi:hypothetical protein
MSSPTSQEYRQQVQNRIQDLVSGARPRDPRLSSISTSRLILEGVVEEVRIYRLHKQEKAREAKEERKREKKRMSGNGHGRREGHRHKHDDGEGGYRHKHRDRSGERHGHRYRERSGERHGKGDRRRHRQRSEEGNRDDQTHISRDGGHDTSRHRHRSRSHQRDFSDPVTESQLDPNPNLLMTGGAGPPGHLPKGSQHPHHRPHSPFSSRNEPRGTPKAGQAGASTSPTHRHGPDGKTPFGHLPARAAGVGVAAHFLNKYKHIKAEHDAGHRERSLVEKTVDGWRGKTPKNGSGGGRGKEKEKPKLRKVDRGKGGERQDDGYQRRNEYRLERGRCEKRSHRRGGRDRGEEGQRDVYGEKSDGHRQPRGPEQANESPRSYAPRNLSPNQAPLEATQSSYHTAPRTPLSHGAHSSLYPRAPTPPELHVQAATPPHEPTWPPTPESFRTSSHPVVPPRPEGYVSRSRPRARSPPTPDSCKDPSRPVSSIRQERPTSDPRSREVSPPRPGTARTLSRSPSPRRSERHPSRLSSRGTATPTPYRQRSISAHKPEKSYRSRSRPAFRSRHSPSRTPSPPYPDSHSGHSISPILMPPPPSAPHVSAASSIPPPPPLPPLANPKPSPARAKLFNQIQGGVPKLRKVQSSEKRDRGDVASAGQVYEETMHSQDVEDRERDEAMSGWRAM